MPYAHLPVYAYVYTHTYFNYSICQADIQLCTHTHTCTYAYMHADARTFITWSDCFVSFLIQICVRKPDYEIYPGGEKLIGKGTPQPPRPPPSYGVTTIHWASSIARALLKRRLMFAGLVTGWRRSVGCLVFISHFPLVQFEFVPRNLSFWIWRRPTGCLCLF